MRGGFYTTLPFLFVLCQQNLPLLRGVELGIRTKTFLSTISLLSSSACCLQKALYLSPEEWTYFSTWERGALSLGTTSDNEHISIFNSASVFDSVGVLVSCSGYVFNHRNYLQLLIKAIIWAVISLNLYDSI